MDYDDGLIISSKKNFTDKLATFVLGVLVSALCFLLHGYTVETLWGWFVYGKFTLVSLTFAEAIGLSVLVGFLTKQYVKQETERSERLAFSVSWSLCTLLIGWVVHLFTSGVL